MPSNLINRSFLKLSDFTGTEIHHLLDLAASLKSAKSAGIEKQNLIGKNVALIFEKPSTRTRVGFEVAAYDQGAHVTYLGPSGTQIGHKETIKDTARVLGRIYDAIEYRGFGQAVVEELAKHAGVPVYNGLTDEFHPTQVLADFLTMREHLEKPLSETVFCFIGDTAGNMADSLLFGAAKLGMEIRLCGPKARWPNNDLVEMAQQIAGETEGVITITDDVRSGVEGCDFLYTDVWVSMGEDEGIWQKRIEQLRPYQVNLDLMHKTGNPHVRFMHCLPAFHNASTKIGAQIVQQFGLDAMEVTEEVFESQQSIVFDQAENRMHTIKAVLVATLGG